MLKSSEAALHGSRPRILTVVAALAMVMLASLPVAAQNDIDFSPAWAPPEGGTEIHLRATSVYHRFYDPVVFFGDIQSPKTTLIDSNRITAIAPPHEVGIVKVTVVDSGYPLRSMGSFAFRPELEEILIPIAVNNVEAGYGTRWVSEITVFNASDQRIPVDPQICYDFADPVICRRPVRWVEPHSSIRIEPHSKWADYPSMMLRPPANQADHLYFTVRLHELSRTPDGPGVQVPVVRARDFDRSTVWLTAVPTGTGYRSTLRVYSRNAEVMVRVRDEATGKLLSEQVLRRWIPLDVDPFGTVTVHDLLSHPAVRASERVRIEVIGSTVYPVWAMLSLTDNQTQRVELFTPQ